MPLTTRTPSKHNQMLGRLIKHPESTNFYDNEPSPSKRRRVDDVATKPPSTPRKPCIHSLEILEKEEEEEVVDNNEIQEEAVPQTDLESALPPVKTDAEAIKEYEALKESQQEETSGAEDRLKDRKWIRGKSSIYVDAFNLALDTVLDEESHLFDEAEMEVFDIWKQLDYQAQYLYVLSLSSTSVSWSRTNPGS